MEALETYGRSTVNVQSVIELKEISDSLTRPQEESKIPPNSDIIYDKRN